LTPDYTDSPLWDPDPFGFSRDGAESILTEEAGFCGCGQPGEAAATLHRILKAMRARRARWLSEPALTDQLSTVAGLDSGQGEVFLALNMEQEPGVAYLLLYMLANLDIEEHGGSVPGWLTPKGEMLCELLDIVEETIP